MIASMNNAAPALVQIENNDEHLGTLDGVRGAAAIAVLISHLANAKMLPAIFGTGFGRMGVALFFVLSGFLMAYLYAHRKFDAPTVARYLRSRAARVLPLYFLIVAVSAPALSFWTYDVGPRLLQHVALIKAHDVLWTIPVEIHFYVVFLLLWAAPSRILAIAFLLTAGFILSIVAINQFGEANVLPVWLPFFLIGAIFGLIHRSNPHRIDHISNSNIAAGLGWMVLAAIIPSLPQLRREMGLLGEYSSNPWSDPIGILIPIAVFVCSLYSLGPFRFLSSPTCRWLGSISFGAYLIHMLVIQNLIHLADTSFSAWNLLLALAVIALTLAIAHLSLKFFEKPVQNLVTRRSKILPNLA